MEELESLKTEIAETEQHLAALRKEYKEKRYANLRAAIETRNEADRAVRDEMKKLNIGNGEWDWIRQTMPPLFRV